MADTDVPPFYIRVRGRILGPYSVEQLSVLRSRGQFGRANEVSTDRQEWKSAATIEHLIGGKDKARRNAPEPPEDEFELPAEKSVNLTLAPIWHYAIGEEQHGPVTMLELRGLITGKQLVEQDLVWKDGMGDWTPIANVPELKAVIEPKAAKKTKTAKVVNSGMRYFCYACGEQMDRRAEVCPLCGVRSRSRTRPSGKSRVIAILLAFFLGGLGIHHFYLGNIGRGVLYILVLFIGAFANLVLLLFLPSVLALVDLIILVFTSDASFKRRYGDM